ncbi:MAG: glycosyltransferase [Candidatus Latescibacteria bacterium]|nr:glycosyltransferase [bacterium]MBD3424379.1 glycosyltransferase [Candidatus Latescibacterota bacterium]
MKVVCFSEIQFRYVRTRKQQILSRFPKDWDILFLSSVVAGKRNNFLPEREGRIVHLCVPVFKNFPQKSVRFIFSLPPVRFLWNILLFLWLKVVLLSTGFHGRETVFYVSNIYYSAILKLLPRKLMLYDCNDDPMEFPDVQKWAGRYFRSLAFSADLVVAVSRGLKKKLEDMGVEKVYRIANGVDYHLFSRSAAAGIPEEMKQFKRPVIGYAGAIARWFDTGLLDRLAEELPDVSIVLMGPLFESRRGDIERITGARNNLFYIGSKPYRQLGAYLAALDVCLIPLVMNDLMKYADPNKLYEYAAVGKPIVSMRFSEEMDRYGDFIYLSRTEDQFVDNVRTALSIGADTGRLRDFARKSSWQARADRMAELIMEHYREEE